MTREEVIGLRIFYTTDIHGSERCWKKFVNAGKFYQADVLILGGDMTGKSIVQIIKEKNELYRVNFMDQQMVLERPDQVAEVEQAIRNRGYYPVTLEPEEVRELEGHPEQVEELFVKEAVQRVKEWVIWAEERLSRNRIPCYVCPGNDDMFQIDAVFSSCEWVHLAEGEVIQFNDGYSMISTGWSNRTPWKTFRECDEPDLLRRIEAMTEKVPDMAHCIFNFHCPPYGSGLDEAPELDQNMRPRYAGRSLIPVGSIVVRDAIQKYQPVLGLFGHVHEAKGTARIGRTLCINPGSTYEQGVLQGTLIDLEEHQIGKYLLTAG